jgi:hypothetical protein
MTTWVLILILHGTGMVNGGMFVDPDDCKEAGERWESSDRPWQPERKYECIPVQVRLP